MTAQLHRFMALAAAVDVEWLAATLAVMAILSR